jgi:hypothetical protein
MTASIDYENGTSSITFLVLDKSAIAYSANDGERSLEGRYKGCEAANPVDARYSMIINESRNPSFATGISYENLKSLPTSSLQKRPGWPRKASS